MMLWTERSYHEVGGATCFCFNKTWTPARQPAQDNGRFLLQTVHASEPRCVGATDRPEPPPPPTSAATTSTTPDLIAEERSQPASEELSLDTSGLGISHSYAERVGLGLAGEPAQFELNKEKLLQMTNTGLRTAPIDIPPRAGWGTQSKQGAPSIEPMGRLVGQMGKMEQAEEGAVHFYKPVDGVFTSSRPAKLGDRL